MKKILSIFFCGMLAFSAASAQNTGSASFSVETLQAIRPQSGQFNYLVSFSLQDFSQHKYVFYTDSDAHVAYININGNPLRLTGGANAERIMAYSGYGYTVTLNNIKRNTAGNITATMVVFDSMGKAVVKEVTGTQAN